MRFTDFLSLFVLPWSLSVPDRPQYLRLRSGVWVCRSITAAMNRVLLTESGKNTQVNTMARFSAQIRSLNKLRASLKALPLLHLKYSNPYILILLIMPFQSMRSETILTDSSVLVAVFVPLISFVIQVWHSHWHFWSSMALKRTRKTLRWDRCQDSLIRCTTAWVICEQGVSS